MPEQLVARLENALAVEAAARGEIAATDGTAAAKATGAGAGARRLRIWRGQSGQGTPGRPATPRQWRGAVLGTAAMIALILVLGGVYGLTKVLHQNGPSSASGGSARPAGAHAFATGGSRDSRESSGSMAALPYSALPVTASGTDYQPATLARQVESLLGIQKSSAAKNTPPANAGTEKAEPAQLITPQASSPQLRACVTLVTGGVPPRLVDKARYQGRPATVIVQAAAGKPAQVWVVGPGCSASQRDLIAHTEIPGS
jgi:hypothetical protein